MIEIKQLSFAYNAKDKLFKEISLSLKPGGICGLLGKNGSGKTSLLKIMTGLIFPAQGKCRILGKNPAYRQTDFLQEIYFLPEDIYVPALDIDNYLKCYKPFYPRFDETILRKGLDEFELPTNKLLSTFSYGQKKKFLIAFGLATQTQLLILDEPTNGLDIPSKTQFRKLLASTISDDKLFIISTHQVHDVENLIDSIIILDEGKIILHQDMFSISQRLIFMQQQVAPNRDDCFYYEKNMRGYMTVLTNTTDQDTHIDLEVLFNATLANKSKLQHIFVEEKSK